MKRWVIGAFCFLISGLAQSQDKDLKFANDMLVTAKVAGMCGTFKQMFAFQEATQMPGGDEFIERFFEYGNFSPRNVTSRVHEVVHRFYRVIQ